MSDDHGWSPSIKETIICMVFSLLIITPLSYYLANNVSPKHEQHNQNVSHEVKKDDHNNSHHQEKEDNHKHNSEHHGIPPLISCLPFVLMLASIALFPFIPKFGDIWHHSNAVKGIWAIFLASISTGWMLSVGGHATIELRNLIIEYPQFIVYVGSLYILSGGIFIDADIQATPKNNTFFMLSGILLASIMGTPGALMLILRALLLTNKQRRFKTHTVIFSIFTIGNLGGALTPLGDPPLFMGFTRGVPFFWTLNLIPQWVLANLLLLLAYWAIDCKYYGLEKESDLIRDDVEIKPLNLKAIKGLGLHIFLFIGLIASVVYLPSIHIDKHHSTYIPFREFALCVLAYISYKKSADVHKQNKFNFGPILEVAALFIGIFITMAAPLTILASQKVSELPSNLALYLKTGIFSSILDNAPTYVINFTTILQKGIEQTDTNFVHVNQGSILVSQLMIISVASVFFGCLTYVGNAPNFMGKSMAEDKEFKISMPGFFGYTFYALLIVAPVLMIIYLIFIGKTQAEFFYGCCLCVGYFMAFLYYGSIKSLDIKHKYS